MRSTRSTLRRASPVSLLASTLALFATGCANVGPGIEPAGDAKTVKTEVLEAGAAVLQTNDVFDAMDVYLVGFHPMKDDPSHQMEAHHFCRQVNEDFAQCALFDGNTARSNLNGIEYIISETLFDTLPEQEKRYWHPHNYEILSGTLVAPGLPAIAELKLMRGKMNSYGKTWHVWSTGNGTDAGDELPLGEPMLAWSLNRDGEAAQGLVERRDERLGMDTESIRRGRQELLPLAEPQRGVDTLRDAFPRPTRSIPGIEERP